MNGIKIHINKLGLVRDSSYTLKPLTFFSGHSSLGKSYCAFISYFIYHFFDNVRLAFFFEEKYGKEPLENLTIQFDIQELKELMRIELIPFMKKIVGNPNLEIDVTIDFDMPIGPYNCSCIKETVDLDIENSEIEKKEFYSVMINGKAVYRDQKQSLSPAFLIGFLLSRELSERILAHRYKSAFILPPSRGALFGYDFSSSDPFPKGSMYTHFFNKINPLKNQPNITEREQNQDLTKLLNGNLVQDNNEFYFNTENGDKLPIVSTASSIKELAPLAYILTKEPIERISLLFEEPEAHLHPLKQVEMADIIARLVNNGMHMQITTHSDYILRRINDLIRLSIIRDKDKEMFKELLSKYSIDEGCVLDPQKIGAYYLSKNQDGYVSIETQDISCGIPFDTFDDINKAIDANFEILDKSEC